jgi:hypothetical protein
MSHRVMDAVHHIVLHDVFHGLSHDVLHDVVHDTSLGMVPVSLRAAVGSHGLVRARRPFVLLSRVNEPVAFVYGLLIAPWAVQICL